MQGWLLPALNIFLHGPPLPCCCCLDAHSQRCANRPTLLPRLTLPLTHPPFADQERLSEFDLKLMDIDSEHLGIPEAEYDATVKLPAGEFQRIVKDLASIGDTGVWAPCLDTGFACGVPAPLLCAVCLQLVCKSRAAGGLLGGKCWPSGASFWAANGSAQ